MVRFAVLGCGRISELHLEAVEKAKNATLIAVCDIVEDKARTVSEKYNVPYYLDLEDMLKSENPDAVIIGTPSGMHGDHAIICAKHKVNVLCEKPIDISSDKIDEMARAFKENGVKIGGIFQRRTYSAAVEAKKAIADGKIGKPVMCDGYFKYNRPQEYYDSDAWRGTWALDGGGALMNQCIHGIDMLIDLCGDIESVSAKCVTLARNIEVEDTAIAVVKYKSGAIGVIEAATSCDSGDDTIIDIRGTEGKIIFGDDKFYGWNLNDDTPSPEITDSMGGKNCAWTGVWEGHRLLVENMAECIENDTKPLIPIESARKAVDVILAIYKSSKTGKEVFLK